MWTTASSSSPETSISIAVLRGAQSVRRDRMLRPSATRGPARKHTRERKPRIRRTNCAAARACNPSCQGTNTRVVFMTDNAWTKVRTTPPAEGSIPFCARHHEPADQVRQCVPKALSAHPREACPLARQLPGPAVRAPCRAAGLAPGAPPRCCPPAGTSAGGATWPAMTAARKSFKVFGFIRKVAGRSGRPIVAQTSSLLYRGFPIRKTCEARTRCRLEAGDTAGWKPALRGGVAAGFECMAFGGINRSQNAAAPRPRACD